MFRHASQRKVCPCVVHALECTYNHHMRTSQRAKKRHARTVQTHTHTTGKSYCDKGLELVDGCPQGWACAGGRGVDKTPCTASAGSFCPAGVCARAGWRCICMHVTMLLPLKCTMCLCVRRHAHDEAPYQQGRAMEVACPARVPSCVRASKQTKWPASLSPAGSFRGLLRRVPRPATLYKSALPTTTARAVMWPRHIVRVHQEISAPRAPRTSGAKHAQLFCAVLVDTLPPLSARNSPLLLQSLLRQRHHHRQQTLGTARMKAARRCC